MALRAPDPTLEADLRERLERVEETLRAAASSDTPLVAGPAMHLLEAGGKRIRPMLVLVASHFGEPAEPKVIDGAAAVELMHLATLYHDDVIDEATSRRGRPSVNARWGNTVAILTGDFLFARASEIAARLGEEISELLATTVSAVCEGQIRETGIAGNVEADEAGYMEVIRRKTASLMSTACRVGGILARADPETAARLGAVGQALGLAFQLSDDIMDLTADEATLGKEPGADMRAGVYTLPVIFAMREGERSEELRALLGSGPPRGEVLRTAVDIVRTDGALELARDAVSAAVRDALRESSGLPSGPPREALEHLAGYLAVRCGAAR